MTLSDPTSTSDPIALVVEWFRAAEAAGVKQPDAMTLATATLDGRPSARMVLFKGMSGERFRFFTNYRSRKGEELAQNPRCALVLHWRELERQIRIEGLAQPLDAAESDEYFATRPRGSQLGAHASPQSRTIDSADTLAAEVARLESGFEGRPVPRPAHWGGYGVSARRIEFWIGRQDRLHDRYAYERAAQRWRFSLLAP